MLLSIAAILVAEPTITTSHFTFLPQEDTLHNGIVRRDCLAAAPDVNETAVSEGKKSLDGLL